MMGLQEMMLALMMTIFGGTSGNELLDYVDADVYFESKGVELTVESLMLEAKKPDVNENSFAKEASVRRLLAIRALGDLKNKKALNVLKEFSVSKEMFVADYAKKSIAKIEAKPAAKAVNTDSWKSDLPLIPKEAGVIAHMKLNPLNGKPGLMQKIGLIQEMLQMKDADKMKQEMKKGMVKDFYPVLDRIGNLRIDSATIAVSDQVGNKTGWVTGVVRGQYDKQALLNFINQEAADDIDIKKVGTAVYLMPVDTFTFGLQDNNTINFLAGPDEENMPIAAMQKAFDEKNERLAYSEKLQNLVKKTEKKGNLWVSALVTGEMLTVPYIKEFKTIRIETEKNADKINGAIIGEGTDAKAVKTSMDEMEKLYADFLENQLDDMKQHTPPSMKPMIKAFESLRFRTREKEAIVTFELPQVDPMTIMLGLFGMQSVDLEGDVELEDEAMPDPPKAIPSK